VALTKITGNGYGAGTITTDDNSANLTLKSTDADGGRGPDLVLTRDSASPADGDAIGFISWTADNDAGAEHAFCGIEVLASDVSDGSEDATWSLVTQVAGTSRSRLSATPTETVFNEDSVDVDFRVESNGNANMLVVDGGNDKVGIGTASGSGQVTIQGDGSTRQLVITDDDAERLQLYLIGNNATIEAGSSGSNSTNLIFKTSNSGTEAERMRLDSGGRLFINQDTAPLGAKMHLKYAGNVEQGFVIENSVNSQNGAAIRFLDHAGATSGGGIFFTSSNSITYADSSDARLKENIVDMTGAIERVKALAPKRFNFISDPDDTTVDGFLAHEAQAVVPEAVVGTENGVDDDDNPMYQGLDASRLVPLLTGALKEAIAKIETLETEMTALKARVTALEA